MQIDEFVDIYTPLELDKLETKKTDGATRHSSLLGKMANQAVQESLRGRADVSPQKAARIIKDYFNAGNKFTTMFAVPRRRTSPPKKSRSSFEPSS